MYRDYSGYRTGGSPIMSAQEFSRSRNFTPVRGRRFSLTGYNDAQNGPVWNDDQNGSGWEKNGPTKGRMMGSMDAPYGRNYDHSGHHYDYHGIDYAKEGDFEIPSYLKSTDSKRWTSWNCTPNKFGSCDAPKSSLIGMADYAPMNGVRTNDGHYGMGHHYGHHNGLSGGYFGASDGWMGRMDGYAHYLHHPGRDSYACKDGLGTRYGGKGDDLLHGGYAETGLWNNRPRRDSFTGTRYDSFLDTEAKNETLGPYMRWENIDNGLVTKSRMDTWNGTTGAFNTSPLLGPRDYYKGSPLNLSINNHTIDRIKNNMDACKAADYRTSLHSGPMSSHHDGQYGSHYGHSGHHYDEYSLSKRIDNIKRIYDSSNLGKNISPSSRYLDLDDIYERAKKQKQQLLSINRL